MVHLLEGPDQQNITEDRRRKKAHHLEGIEPLNLCYEAGAHMLCYNPCPWVIASYFTAINLKDDSTCEHPDLVGHLGVVSSARVAVAEDDVVQEIGDDALRVHQLADRLQHRLEVVLLRLSPHHDVEGLVHVLAAARHALLRHEKRVVGELLQLLRFFCTSQLFWPV